MAFSNIGYFPFCIREESPSVVNTGVDNNLLGITGATGVGTVYPVGMTLYDAMTLYWKARGITWEIYQSITYECVEFDEEEQEFVPTGELSIFEDYVDSYCLLKDTEGETKPSTFTDRVCPKFEHRFTGTMTRSYGNCPPDPLPEVWVNPTVTTNSYYPMSCFYVPLDFGGVYPQLTVPYRILKHQGLYYPSLLLAFAAYSRLYATKWFIPATALEDWEYETHKTVYLEINGNEYGMDLLVFNNYTREGEYEVSISDVIYLDTWT